MKKRFSNPVSRTIIILALAALACTPVEHRAEALGPDTHQTDVIDKKNYQTDNDPYGAPFRSNLCPKGCTYYAHQKDGYRE